ncbi:MAG TPA: hypothetical protein VGP47_11790, partial [Parachlamydiaceae bacterium]|nr:hypothetical protein [Parachlamydiaceae bacterium]
LLIIGSALEKIEKNNILSGKSIKRAEESQEEASKKIGEIDKALDELVELFKSAIGKQSENIEQAIAKLKLCKGALIQQSHDLGQASVLLQKSREISAEQSKQLGDLLSAKYKINNEDDLKIVVEQINLSINAIKGSSDEAYSFQTKAMTYLLKAVGEKNELISMHHDLTTAFTQIELLNLQLEKTEEKVDKIKIKKQELKQEVAKTNQELDALKKIKNEDRIEVKIAKENLEEEKKKEHWGETSTIYGGALTGGVGATLGLILSGPAAALALGGIAFVGLGTSGVRAVHRARLAMRKNQLEKKKMELEGLQKGLESNKFQKTGKVIVSAEYGYSQGSYLGARSLKGVWNATGYIVNYASGKEVMGEFKSSHAGVVKCVIGNIPITFNFDKTTGPSLAGALVPSYMDVSGSDVTNAAYKEYLKYGAISQIDQTNLSDVLLTELKNGTLKPQMVLDFLNKLSQAQIGNEVIVMIRPDSPLLEILRSECKTMLEEKGK